MLTVYLYHVWYYLFMIILNEITCDTLRVSLARDDIPPICVCVQNLKKRWIAN